MIKCFYVDLGVVDYQQALDMQYKLVELRGSDRIEDVLLLVEHPPVITVGTKRMERKMTDQEIEAMGIKVFHVERGGGETYHGPQQLVAYPIADFRRMFGYEGGATVPYSDISKFTGRLEETMLRTLSDFGVRDVSRYKGLWHNDKKIGSRAVGIKVAGRSLVTMHGSALDVNTNQENFDLIFPCGYQDKGVTSMEKALGRRVPMEQVKESFVKNFGAVFGYEMERAPLNDLLGLAAPAD